MKYQKKYLEKFPSQIEYTLSNYIRHNLNAESFRNIVICGLGGSGIAGRIIKSFFYDTSPVPIEIVSDYSLPFYVNENSLVIISSYSGNTEETLSLYIQAVERHAHILAITTGGLLNELATENNIQVYLSEPGFQPRMALGYSLTYLFLIFSELFHQNLQQNYKSLLGALRNTNEFIKEGKLLIPFFQEYPDNKIVIITDPPTYPIGIRFAQQLQENAKTEAFVHEIPEANHNVIETYYGRLNSSYIMIDSGLNEKISSRFEFLQQLLKGQKNITQTMNINGFTLREIYLLIYRLDWLSLLIAEMKNKKSDEIVNIVNLKNFLSN